MTTTIESTAIEADLKLLAATYFMFTTEIQALFKASWVTEWLTGYNNWLTNQREAEEALVSGKTLLGTTPYFRIKFETMSHWPNENETARRKNGHKTAKVLGEKQKQQQAIDGLNGWLIDWLSKCLIDWLID